MEKNKIPVSHKKMLDHDDQRPCISRDPVSSITSRFLSHGTFHSVNCVRNSLLDAKRDVLSASIFWGSRFFSRRLRRGLRAINLGPQKIEGHSICPEVVNKLIKP